MPLEIASCLITRSVSPGMTTPVGLLGVVTTTSFGFGRFFPDSELSSQPEKWNGSLRKLRRGADGVVIHAIKR